MSDAELQWCGRLLNDETRAVVATRKHPVGAQRWMYSVQCTKPWRYTEAPTTSFHESYLPHRGEKPKGHDPSAFFHPDSIPPAPHTGSRFSVHSPDPYMLIRGDPGNEIPPKAAPYQESKPSGATPRLGDLAHCCATFLFYLVGHLTMLHHYNSDSLF